MSTPVSHNVRLFTLVPLGKRPGLTALLDALDAARLAPTHYGRDERSKTAFERDPVLDRTVAGAPTALALIRRKPPSYVCWLDASKKGLAGVSIETGAVKDPRAVYDLADRLALALAIEHGVVNPKFEGHGKFNAAGKIELQWLQDFGPLYPGARNWYGLHMQKLFGDALRRTGGALADMPWGAVRLDLVADPWGADVESLERRQREAIAALADAKVLGDYSDPDDIQRGPRWKPIPEQA